ncbi:MAG: penicillin-binding protein activator LpoB [Gammaproteobacteria bacterium]|nr:penicillin-binding protein activator LpoB [Gammaproteobacteria bacterium]
MKKLIFYSLTLLFLSACQTHLPIISESNHSKEANCQENIEQMELADIDYLLYANKMIDSMIQSQPVQAETAKNRMRLSLSPVTHSRTDVDMTFLNTSIKNRILRSGLFILVNDVNSGDFQLSGVFKELHHSNDSCPDKKQKIEEFILQLNEFKKDTIVWSEKKQFNTL